MFGVERRKLQKLECRGGNFNVWSVEVENLMLGV